MRECFCGYRDANMSSKKGHKLSKAQKVKQQKEEEERRLQEEEEARLQAEKEEQQRLDKERKEKERERLELKDRECRESELSELRHLLEENHTALTTWKADAVENAKWERYMRCDGCPDPAVQQDINTYISLWRDDQEVSVTPVLKQCNLALQLVEELEALLTDVTDPQEALKYQEAVVDLQELIHSKHNLTTEEILKSSSENTDTETGNMQTVVKDENMTLCLWANLEKSPRFKGLNFEEVGFGFELPKQLAVSDIAVRILHAHYDHLTSLARMTHQKIHPLSRRLSRGDEIPAGVDLPQQRETSDNSEDKDDHETQQQRVDEEVRSIQGLEGRKSAASQRSRKSSAQATEGRGSQIQTQMEALSAKGELTSPLEDFTVVDSTGHVQVVDLLEYTPLGGVFYFDVFQLPPQAHHVNNWEIRQLLDTGLQVFHYPTEKSSPDDDDTVSFPPVAVSVRLPNGVVFLETPQVARWDSAGKQWRMDGITDVSFKEEEANIAFKMDSFQAFVLMQETYANFPFLSWELKPVSSDSAVFTVKGAFIDLTITIQGDQCMLQSEQEKGLSHLLGKWMSAPALQRAMLNAGINIFVNEHTDKYVSTCGKDPLTEHAAYEQMALFAPACAFSWSRWNAKCGAEHLVMQVCENHGPAPVTKDPWHLYLLGAQMSLKLEMTEKSEAFSPDHYPGSELHSTFIHTLQDMSTDGIARTRESNYVFVSTVQTLLCATRPLMYS